MKWDQSRPVPWDQLVRTWLIYVAVMAVVFVLLFRESNLIGIMGGLLVSGPLYLAIGYVLAKLGYRRQTLKELRAERDQKTSTKHARTGAMTTDASAPSQRPRPAPTKRTGGGASNRPPKRKR